MPRTPSTSFAAAAIESICCVPPTPTGRGGLDAGETILWLPPGRPPGTKPHDIDDPGREATGWSGCAGGRSSYLPAVS